EISHLKKDIASRDSEIHENKLQLSTFQASIAVKEEYTKSQIEELQNDLIRKESELRHLNNKNCDFDRETSNLQTENMNLRTRINGLNYGNEMSSQNTAMISENIKSLEARISTSEAKFAQAQAELDASKEKLESRGKTIVDLQNIERENSEAINGMKIHVKTLESELSKTRSEKEQIEHQAQALDEKNLVSAEKIRTSEHSITELKRLLQIEIQQNEKNRELLVSIQASQETIYTEASILRELNSRLNDDLERKEEELKNSRELVNQCQCTLAIINSQIKSRDQEIVIFKNLALEKDSIVENLRVQLEETRKRFHEIEELLKHNQVSIGELEKKLDNTSSLNRELLGNIQILERSSDKIKSELMILQEENIVLKNGSQTNFLDEISKLKKQYEDILHDIQRDLADYKQNSTQLQVIISSRDEEIKILRHKIDAEVKQSKNSRSELQRATTNSERKESENNMLQTELNNKECLLKELQYQLTECEKNNRDLKEKYDTLQNSLGDILKSKLTENTNDPEETIKMLKNFTSGIYNCFSYQFVF
ncbi:hypothetical protein HK096_000494, partial [Nowakowskiella sp. JEL0078]